MELQEAATHGGHSPERVHPEARRGQVRRIADALVCGEVEDEREVLPTLDKLTADPEWSVRAEVAKMVYRLSDEACSRLVGHFRRDCNRYVRTHAERSLARLSKTRQASARNRQALSAYGDGIAQLQQQHGPALAVKVRALADKRYGRLAGAVGHDVRGILTTLGANVAALAAEFPGNRRVDSIQEDIGYLYRTIEAMEQFICPLPAERHPEPLIEMAREAVEKALAGVNRQGFDYNAVQIEITADRSIKLRVARRLIVLALTNLVQNALESFADQDSDTLRPGRIDVEATMEGYETRLTVRDDGPGVEPEVLKQLRSFTPSGTNKAKRDSSGWGLSLAQRYIEAHKGTLVIDSTVDEGTELTITLPTQEAEEDCGE